MKSSLLFTLAVAVALTGCNKSTRSGTTTADTRDYTTTGTTTTTTTTTTGAAVDRMSNDMRSAANNASDAIGSAASNVASSARMAQWKLTATDIQADLDHNREIVRTKDSATTPTGNADKSVIESMIKSRLQADSALANLKLDVDADRKGEVKLSGKAHSAEEVGRAIALALDTDGVTRVSSKIKLDSDAKTNR